MEPNIIAAQKRLEEKRACLAIATKPTFSPDYDDSDGATVNMTCYRCKDNFTIPRTEIVDTPRVLFKFWKCGPCQELSVQEENERADRKRQEEIEEERKRIEAINASRLTKLAIGERFRGMTWADYVEINQKAEKAKAVCEEYAETFARNSGRCLMMLGSPGTGKNMLAAIIAQEIIKRGFTCLHTTALKMVRKVKDSWRDKEISEQEVIDQFNSPDLLVIDEVGVQFGSQTEQLYLTEIINDRYEAKKPTIIISNLDGAQLKAIMGERVIDRFCDDGSRALAFDWPSYRRRGKG